MVLPFKKAMDSLFKRCGKVGMYKGRQVLFLLIEPDSVIGVGFTNAHTDTHIIKIRVSDAPELALGDKIIVGNDAYTIQSEPLKDIHNLIFTADVICN